MRHGLTACDESTTLNRSARRVRRACVRRYSALSAASAVCVVVVLLLPAVLFAQQTDIRITKVREHFFMLTGAGGNVAALVFPEGITLVDSGRTEMGDKLLAALRTLSPNPIRYIINTSVDPDHTGEAGALDLGIHCVLE